MSIRTEVRSCNPEFYFREKSAHRRVVNTQMVGDLSHGEAAGLVGGDADGSNRFMIVEKLR